MDNQGERMARLEQKVENIESNVNDVKEMLTTFIERSEQRFASKWVEDWVVWGGRLVIGAVIVAVLSLVIISTK